MKTPAAHNLNFLWGQLLIEELLRNGVEYFCLSPGSRSSPLAVAIGTHPQARAFVHFDERGSAFHALGFVSATRKPAVVLCTSGTAVANLFPAVIEASKKKLPLIVLTADRPPELRQTGANQTIDQPGIFGPYARWQSDLPCPAKEIHPEFILTSVDQAVYRARRSPGGPVHLNCMFREPLSNIDSKETLEEYQKNLQRWKKSTEPFTRYIAPASEIDPDVHNEISSAVKRIKNGVIAVGKLYSDAQRAAVLAVARKLEWPLFPDVTSGLRMGAAKPQVISYFDQLLLSKKLREQLPVDGVLHLGGRMTSKRFHQFLEEKKPQNYVMVLDHPLRNDPQHAVSLRIEASVTVFCERLILETASRKKTKHLQLLQKLNAGVDELFETELGPDGIINEPAVARLVSQLTPKGHGLFLGNSMPVRDMDMFADQAGTTAVIGANRGASGIDGNIATVAGFAQGLKAPVTAVLGDLAFLHDLNSLAMVKKLGKPVVFVVLNNDGGAIFSFLPIAEHPQNFEEFFAAAHGLKFEAAAALFGLEYANPRTMSEFKTAYERALKGEDPIIIEVLTDRKENVKWHEYLQERVVKEIEKNLG